MLFSFIYYSIQILLVFIFVLCVFFYLYQKYSRFCFELKKIPQSPAVPILGHSLEWALVKDPWTHVRYTVESYKPLIAVYAFHLGGVIMLHLDDVEKLLSSTKLIKKGIYYNMLSTWLNTGLLTSTGEKWFQRRKILTPAFHFTILQNFLTIFNEATQKFVEDLKNGEFKNGLSVDVLPIVTQFTLSSIAETAMGTNLDKSEESLEYRKKIHEMGDSIAYRALRPWLFNPFIYGLTPGGRKNNKTIQYLHQFTRDVIKNRERMFSQKSSEKPKKRLAMLDLLLSAKNQGENINYEGIREEVDTFMFEGHDTTSSAITFILLILANYQEVQERCYEEIMSVLIDVDKDPTYSELQELSYTERCIKEVLRIYPSVPHIFRTLEEDFKSATGYTVPKGGDILVPIYDIHHSADIYPDPEKFDPDRFLLENCKDRHPYAYIPFSAGPRNCIGQKFAMLEMKTLLCGILKNFRLEPVTTREDVTFRLDLILRPTVPINVKFVPRNN